MYAWIAVIIFVVFGAFSYWRLEKRKFDRCNDLNIEQYKNYFDKIYTLFIDKLIWWSCIISFISAFLIAVSVMDPSLISMFLFYSIIYDLLKSKKHA